MTRVFIRGEDRDPKKLCDPGAEIGGKWHRPGDPGTMRSWRQPGRVRPRAPRTQNGRAVSIAPCAEVVAVSTRLIQAGCTNPHSGARGLDLPLSQRGHRASRHRRGRYSRILRTLAPSWRPQDNSRVPQPSRRDVGGVVPLPLPPASVCWGRSDRVPYTGAGRQRRSPCTVLEAGRPRSRPPQAVSGEKLLPGSQMTPLCVPTWCEGRESSPESLLPGH